MLVQTIDTGGEILTVTASGSAFTGTGTATGVAPTFNGNAGTGAQLNLTKTNGLVMRERCSGPNTMVSWPMAPVAQ